MWFRSNNNQTTRHVDESISNNDRRRRRRVSDIFVKLNHCCDLSFSHARIITMICKYQFIAIASFNIWSSCLMLWSRACVFSKKRCACSLSSFLTFWTAYYRIWWSRVRFLSIWLIACFIFNNSDLFRESEINFKTKVDVDAKQISQIFRRRDEGSASETFFSLFSSFSIFIFRRSDESQDEDCWKTRDG